VVIGRVAPESTEAAPQDGECWGNDLLVISMAHDQTADAIGTHCSCVRDGKDAVASPTPCFSPRQQSKKRRIVVFSVSKSAVFAKCHKGNRKFWKQGVAKRLNAMLNVVAHKITMSTEYVIQTPISIFDNPNRTMQNLISALWYLG
jgi:hypothetical protein